MWMFYVLSTACFVQTPASWQGTYTHTCSWSIYTSFSEKLQQLKLVLFVDLHSMDKNAKKMHLLPKLNMYNALCSFPDFLKVFQSFSLDSWLFFFLFFIYLLDILQIQCEDVERPFLVFLVTFTQVFCNKNKKVLHIARPVLANLLHQGNSWNNQLFFRCLVPPIGANTS